MGGDGIDFQGGEKVFVRVLETAAWDDRMYLDKRWSASTLEVVDGVLAAVAVYRFYPLATVWHTLNKLSKVFLSKISMLQDNGTISPSIIIP